MTPIRWLHLSDFHTGKDEHGQRQLFASILKHMDQRIAEQGAPDFVFITGDIAQSAKPEQYNQFAMDFLAGLEDKAGEGRILMVPGNHDVDQNQQKFISRDKIRQSTEFFDPTPRGLAEREHLLPRFQAYRDCEWLVVGEDWLASEAGCLLRIFELNDIQVGVLGLDTAWLSEGGKSDERELTPGKPLVEAGLAAIAEAEIKIVLGHHPLDWLHPEDRKPIEALLGQHRVIYLHGHMHRNDAGFGYGAGNLFLTLQSGAGFLTREDEKWVNRLLWAELDRENQRIALEPYQWSKRHQQWKLDFEAFSDDYRQPGTDRWRFPLPGTLIPQAGKPGPSPAKPPERKFKAPLGWELVDQAYLASLDTHPEEAVILGYFDGRQPNWGLALCPQVPRRAVVGQLAGRILAGAGNGHPTVNLLLGAGGEGKTTAFFQIIEQVLRADDSWRVLRRRGENAELSRKWVDELPRRDGQHWLIASDDADQIAEDVYHLVTGLQTKGRGDVHFLLSARHTEWRDTNILQHRWEALPGYREQHLRGLDEADAREIVAAWGEYRERGLGKLAGLSPEEAARRLVEASRLEVSPDEGAFLGALLRLRLGDEFRGHVKKLLDRLRDREILPGKRETLLDAFAYVAAMHAENQPFLSKLVLAHALGVETRELRSKVLWPLGEEAAADVAGEMVFTRHRAIAEAALDILRNTLYYAIEPDELYEGLVTTAEELSQKGHFIPPNIKHWRYLSDHFFAKGEPALAIKLARALVRAAPTDSYFRVKLSQLLRRAGQPEQSLKVFRDAPQPDDDRAFFHEWATAEGNEGNHAIAVWLDAVALADATARRPPDNRQTALYLAGLGLACRELFRAYNTPVFMGGCGAAGDLGLRLPYLNPPTKRYLSEHQAAARAEGVGEADPATALKRIRAAAMAAHRQREGDLQDWVQPAEGLTFQGLESLFGIQTGRGSDPGPS